VGRSTSRRSVSLRRCSTSRTTLGCSGPLATVRSGGSRSSSQRSGRVRMRGPRCGSCQCGSRLAEPLRRDRLSRLPARGTAAGPVGCSTTATHRRRSSGPRAIARRSSLPPRIGTVCSSRPTPRCTVGSSGPAISCGIASRTETSPGFSTQPCSRSSRNSSEGSWGCRSGPGANDPRSPPAGGAPLGPPAPLSERPGI